MNRKFLLTTVDAERDLLAEAEMTFALAQVPDAAARAKVICIGYRYRARRGASHVANLTIARAAIMRDVNRMGVAS